MKLEISAGDSRACRAARKALMHWRRKWIRQCLPHPVRLCPSMPRKAHVPRYAKRDGDSVCPVVEAKCADPVRSRKRPGGRGFPVSVILGRRVDWLGVVGRPEERDGLDRFCPVQESPKSERSLSVLQCGASVSQGWLSRFLSMCKSNIPNGPIQTLNPLVEGSSPS